MRMVVMLFVVVFGGTMSMTGCVGPASHDSNGTNSKDGGTADPSSSSGSGEFAPTCGAQTFMIDATQVTPNVYLVVDRSGSMADGFGGNTTGTKWDAAQSSLKSLLTDSAGKAQWGLSMFPPNPSQDTCGKAVIDVPLAAGDETTILGKVDAITNAQIANPKGSTPTADALKTVRDQAMLDSTDRNNYALLMTDGLPNCNSAADVSATIQQLYSRTPSVKTFIVGLGDETASNPDLLNQWATDGHTDLPDPNVKYYQANDATSLGTALSAIIGQTTSCSFKLSSPPADASLVVGTINGVAQALDATDGYTYDLTTQTIVFHGKACSQVETSSTKSVGVVYGCAPAVIQ